MPHTQVILLEKVSKLGALGSLVKVKKGYARNFLIPFKRRAAPRPLPFRNLKRGARSLKESPRKSWPMRNSWAKISRADAADHSEIWRRWTPVWFGDKSGYCTGLESAEPCYRKNQNPDAGGAVQAVRRLSGADWLAYGCGGGDCGVRVRGVCLAIKSASIPLLSLRMDPIHKCSQIKLINKIEH